MIVLEKQYLGKSWMSSHDTSLTKQRFFEENLPRLKPIGENGIVPDQQLSQKQPKLRGSSLFPPVTHSFTAGSIVTNSTTESGASSVTDTSTVRDAVQRFLTRNNRSSSIATGSTPLNIATSNVKRASLYDHIQSKINTGLPRTESVVRTEVNTHRLGPIGSINWGLLKQELEHDTSIRVHAKKIQFNSGVTYTKQLATLGDLIRAKTRYYVSTVMGFGEERYKIVVHLTVFQTITAGLHVASRCLWNTLTDNSVTIRMQGVDCDILIVVFLCYTDLGSNN